MPRIAMVPKNLMKLEGKNASGMLRLQRGSGRSRRRAERLLQLRYRREGVGGAVAVTCASSASIAARERTGYGVIDSDGRDHRMVAAGVIRTSPKWPFEQRLLEIAERLARA